MHTIATYYFILHIHQKDYINHRWHNRTSAASIEANRRHCDINCACFQHAIVSSESIRQTAYTGNDFRTIECITIDELVEQIRILINSDCYRVNAIGIIIGHGGSHCIPSLEITHYMNACSAYRLLRHIHLKRYFIGWVDNDAIGTLFKTNCFECYIDASKVQKTIRHAHKIRSTGRRNRLHICSANSILKAIIDILICIEFNQRSVNPIGIGITHRGTLQSTELRHNDYVHPIRAYALLRHIH